MIVGRDEGGDSLWYTHPVTGLRYPSVTTILGRALDKSNRLVPWSSKIAATFAVDNAAVIQEHILAVGYDATMAWIRLECERLRKLASEIGVHQHNVLEALLLDAPIPPLPEHLEGVEIDGDIVDHDAISDGLINFLSEHRLIFHRAEATVCNTQDGYAGTLDLDVTFVDGVSSGLGWLIHPGWRGIGDLKSGKHIPDEVGAQLEPYRRANTVWLNYDGDEAEMTRADVRFVLHLRRSHPNGYQLRVLDNATAETDYRVFLHAKEILLGEQMQGAKFLPVGYAPRPDGSHPSPLIGDQLMLRAPVRKALIEQVKCTRIEDLEVMSAVELLKLRNIGPSAIADIRKLIQPYGFLLDGDALQQLGEALARVDAEEGTSNAAA